MLILLVFLIYSEFESLAQCHNVKLKSFRSNQTQHQLHTATTTASSYMNQTHDHIHNHTNNTSPHHTDPPSPSPLSYTHSNLLLFKTQLWNICSSHTAESFCIVNFSRKHLQQTGDGHFSPVGMYMCIYCVI